MRSLFAFLGAGLIAFLALGWFLNWYQVNNTPSDGGVKINLNIPKIGEDIKTGERKALNVIENVSKKEKASGAAPAPAGEPGSHVPAAQSKAPKQAHGHSPAEQQLPSGDKNEGGPELPPGIVPPK
jgi:hypothetical protein